MNNAFVRAAGKETMQPSNKTNKAPSETIPSNCSYKKGMGQITIYHGNSKQKATGPTSRVEIFVSAKNLADLDTFTLSDPLCTLKVKNSKHGGYMEYGETEVVDNNLNPKWVAHF